MNGINSRQERIPVSGRLFFYVKCMSFRLMKDKIPTTS
ncbi:hypothetical protein QY95_02042 [Bacillus thermotolerans]|uniref:Uncharacterized protein n=1 Tax=Bacillus thermotolerans TaxID=1221996 RepID=A0A0F5I3H4_BACTR|nr:hypothetical protein QY95_02042 [Bacillus thermotolerans]